MPRALKRISFPCCFLKMQLLCQNHCFLPVIWVFWLYLKSVEIMVLPIVASRAPPCSHPLPILQIYGKYQMGIALHQFYSFNSTPSLLSLPALFATITSIKNPGITGVFSIISLTLQTTSSRPFSGYRSDLEC